MLNVGNQVLITKGVNSKVLEKGERQQYKTIGHIGLFDFDDHIQPISKKIILDRCLYLEGINLLWESSSTGFHLWNLTIRSADETALLGLKLRSDPKHIMHSYNRNAWILRISEKWHNNCIYKGAPKLLHTWVNESSRAQSKAHLELFNVLTGKTILQVNSFEYMGLSKAIIEEYMTVTDEMKAHMKA